MSKEKVKPIELKLRKGQSVTFKAINDFTGQELKLSGVIVSETLRYIKEHRDLKEEYGGVLKDEAYIVKEDSRSEKLNLHLVLTEDIEGKEKS